MTKPFLEWATNVHAIESTIDNSLGYCIMSADSKRFYHSHQMVNEVLHYQNYQVVPNFRGTVMLRRQICLQFSAYPKLYFKLMALTFLFPRLYFLPNNLIVLFPYLYY